MHNQMPQSPNDSVGAPDAWEAPPRRGRRRRPGTGRNGCRTQVASPIAAVLIVCASGVGRLIHYMNDGHDPMVYGRLPLSYLFQTVEVALIGAFGYYGLLEAVRIMRGDD